MKYIQFIIGISIGILLLTSCEDVIILDLKDTEPRLVVEATINITDKVAKVILTETNGFYDNNDPINVEDATVTILKETGVLFDLEQTSPGIYSLSDFDTNAGKEYILTITVGDEVYTASAYAPLQVNLISVDTSLITPPFGPTGSFYQLQGTWLDTEGEDNYYRLRAYQDGEILETPYTLFDDNNFDGEEFRNGIRGGFDPGTLARFELMTIDKEYYNYFLQLEANDSGGFGGTTPFNPKGNIDNRGLGFFGIFSSSNVEIQL